MRHCNANFIENRLHLEGKPRQVEGTKRGIPGGKDGEGGFFGKVSLLIFKVSVSQPAEPA